MPNLRVESSGLLTIYWINGNKVERTSKSSAACLEYSKHFKVTEQELMQCYLAKNSKIRPAIEGSNLHSLNLTLVNMLFLSKRFLKNS